MKKYISIVAILLIILVIGYGLYEDIQKQNLSAKSMRISCQKKVTVFERIYDDTNIKLMQAKLENANYLLSSSIQKAVYSKSKLFDYVNLPAIDKSTIEILNKYTISKDSSDKKLKILYHIYENDIKDPGKKTEKSKLYAGYVVFRFCDYKDKPIYQVQIDFMDKQGADLIQSIKCAIKSFMTIT